jgi:hypothetical protein
MDVCTSGLQWNRYWTQPEALYVSMSVEGAAGNFS